jgi:hypothetical protein
MSKQREEDMKRSMAAGAILGGIFAFVPVGVHAQSEPPAHVMVLPTELKWTDVSSLPPGAKLAVIEGPLNEAVPLIRLKHPGRGASPLPDPASHQTLPLIHNSTK